MGDPRTIADLYRQHGQGLFSVALAILRDPAASEDAVHDAIARLLDRPRVDGDPVAYMYAAVRNAARDLLRRRAVRKADQVHDAIFDAAQLQEWSGEPGSEMRRVLAAAIETLPPEQQEVLIMRAIGRLGFEQIASAIGAPVGTVASRYSRGVQALRSQLEEVVR